MVAKLTTGDPISFQSSLSRNSVLLQFITCGGSASFRATKTVPVVRQQQPPCMAARKSTGSNLHKGVLCKTAAKAAEDEEAEMISCMSENPRFGNLQAEEKEYFSGSIVEAMGDERVQVEPTRLKRSNSYNEERLAILIPRISVPIRLQLFETYYFVFNFWYTMTSSVIMVMDSI